MSKISGIYKIINLANNKIYIGSSIDIKSRWQKHKNLLKTGKHFNDHLQASYNLYGRKNFKYEIIKKYPEDKLIIKEQYYIDKYDSMNPDNGYNKCSANCSVLSHESIGKLSGENSRNAKLTQIQVNIIRDVFLTGKYSIYQLAKSYNVGHRTISNILKYKTWKYGVAKKEITEYIEKKNKFIKSTGISKRRK